MSGFTYSNRSDNVGADSVSEHQFWPRRMSLRMCRRRTVINHEDGGLGARLWACQDSQREGRSGIATITRSAWRSALSKRPVCSMSGLYCGNMFIQVAVKRSDDGPNLTLT